MGFVLKECFADFRFLVLPSSSCTGPESPGVLGFARLLGAAAVLFYTSRLSSTSPNKPEGTHSLRYASPEDFIHQAIGLLPELRPLLESALSEVANICGSQDSRDTLTCFSWDRNSSQGYFLTEAEVAVYRKMRTHENTTVETVVTMHGDVERRVASAYCEVRQQIRSVCFCKGHPDQCGAVAMCETIIVLAYLSGELVSCTKFISRMQLGQIWGCCTKVSSYFCST